MGCLNFNFDTKVQNCTNILATRTVGYTFVFTSYRYGLAYVAGQCNNLRFLFIFLSRRSVIVTSGRVTPQHLILQYHVIDIEGLSTLWIWFRSGNIHSHDFSWSVCVRSVICMRPITALQHYSLQWVELELSGRAGSSIVWCFCWCERAAISVSACILRFSASIMLLHFTLSTTTRIMQ